MNQDKVMLLIDADNVSIDVVEQAVAWVGRHFGGPHVRRAYCTAESAVKHQGAFKRLGIRPMVNLAAGKNSTDIALAVDAIDLAVAERPDVMVIASSDSDFAPLVGRLREKGCKVVGVGQRGKTGDETRMVYDDFEVMDHRKGSSRPAPAREEARRGGTPERADSGRGRGGRADSAAGRVPGAGSAAGRPSGAGSARRPAPRADAARDESSRVEAAQAYAVSIADVHATAPEAPRHPEGSPVTAEAPIEAPIDSSTKASTKASAETPAPPAAPAAKPRRSRGRGKAGSAGVKPAADLAADGATPSEAPPAPAPAPRAAPASPRAKAKARTPAVSPVASPVMVSPPAPTVAEVAVPPSVGEPASADVRRPRRRRSGRSRGPKAEGGAPAAD
jgi:hypothetical protein